MPASPETSGTWESAYGFQLPLQPDQLPAHDQEALQAFAQALLEYLTESLGLVGYDVAFDKRCRLLMRKTPGSQPDAAEIGPGPKPIFAKILEFFKQLNLSSPPPAFTDEPETPPKEAVIAATLTFRERLGQLLQWFSSRATPSVLPADSPAHDSTNSRRETHEQAQFNKLQQWLQDRVPSDELLRAITQWYHATTRKAPDRIVTIEHLPPAPEVMALFGANYDRWLEQARGNPSRSAALHQHIRAVFDAMATRVIDHLTREISTRP